MKMRNMFKTVQPLIVLIICALLLAVASGCTTAQRGEATTATAGHSPIIQMQAGVHFYSSNTRPIQAPDVAAERENMPKFADTITLGDIVVTTTTTISSGAGDVHTTASDEGSQDPKVDVNPDVKITP